MVEPEKNDINQQNERINNEFSNLKVALIHDYLNQRGGAEKTLEAIMELFPNAPIYTGIHEPSKMPKIINERKVYAPNSPILKKFYKYFTFLMPLIFEGFDLSNYDLIISDGTAWPKSVITQPQQLHISYIHTPPRFLYKYSVESTKRNAWYFKPFVAIIDHYLRIWDFSAAQRPDFLATNSIETQKRIKKFYRRDAKVINPPVDVQFSTTQTNNLAKNYYIAIGRFAAYKNFDILIQAFNLLDKKLVIIGGGTEEANLKKLAKSNVSFAGKVSDQEKHNIIEGSLGLINTVADEDFGIVPIEVMAHGKPVLAHKSGGHKEVVQDGMSGMFFEDLSVQGMVNAIQKFDQAIEKSMFDKTKISQSVQKYDKQRFQKELVDFIKSKLNKE